MPRKPLELPPAVARAFVRDMCAYFSEKNAVKRDEIAARQIFALKHKQHYSGKLKLTERERDVLADAESGVTASPNLA